MVTGRSYAAIPDRAWASVTPAMVAMAASAVAPFVSTRAPPAMITPAVMAVAPVMSVAPVPVLVGMSCPWMMAISMVMVRLVAIAVATIVVAAIVVVRTIPAVAMGSPIVLVAAAVMITAILMVRWAIIAATIIIAAIVPAVMAAELQSKAVGTDIDTDIVGLGRRRGRESGGHDGHGAKSQAPDQFHVWTPVYPSPGYPAEFSGLPDECRMNSWFRKPASGRPAPRLDGPDRDKPVSIHHMVDIV